MQIFQDTLRKLHVKAEETVFIGDSPLEDLKGAHAAGLKTVFVTSQFYTLKDLQEGNQKPDCVAHDLEEIYENFSKIISR
jgi:FMN phosphatase YigB (HAD superfamily)